MQNKIYRDYRGAVVIETALSWDELFKIKVALQKAGIDNTKFVALFAELDERIRNGENIPNGKK